MPYNYIPELASKYSSVGNTLSTLNISLTSLDSNLYALSSSVVGEMSSLNEDILYIESVLYDVSAFASFSANTVSAISSISAEVLSLSAELDNTSCDSVYTTVSTYSADWTPSQILFLASTTWNNPYPTQESRPMFVRLVGGGGGGGGGASNALNDIGGGGGGAGASVVEFWTQTGYLASTQNIVVGVSGAGGIADAPGSSGGITAFANISAFGGAGGAAGTTIIGGQGGSLVANGASNGWSFVSTCSGGTGGYRSAALVSPATTSWVPTGGGGGGGVDYISPGVFLSYNGAAGTVQGSNTVGGAIVGGNGGIGGAAGDWEDREADGGNGRSGRSTGTGGGGGGGGSFGGFGGNGGGFGSGGGGGGAGLGAGHGGRGGNGASGYVHIHIF